MSLHITFVTPPPGFAPEVVFALSAVDGADGLYSLSSAPGGGTDGLRIFVLDAAVYVPAYQPEISDDQRTQLELADADDAMVLIVANATEAGTTVNLLAPIILNTRTHRCAQVILEGGNWPVRVPLETAAAA